MEWEINTICDKVKTCWWVHKLTGCITEWRLVIITLQLHSNHVDWCTVHSDGILRINSVPDIMVAPGPVPRAGDLRQRKNHITTHSMLYSHIL